jgi:ribosome-associated translation inhibitor RaiA
MPRTPAGQADAADNGLPENGTFLCHIEVVSDWGKADLHEVNLHALNRWVQYEEGKRIYFSTENFDGTEQAWDAVPAIFSDVNHPDGRLIAKGELNNALEQVNGRICGNHSDAKVVTVGQPRLTIRTNLTDEQAAELYNAGKLAVSSSFICTLNWVGGDATIIGKVKPNHVLYFDSSGKLKPRDPSAMLLFAIQEAPMTNDADPNEKVRSAFDTVVEFLKGKSAPPVKGEDTMDTELKNTVKTLEAELASAKAQVTDRDAKVQELQTTVDNMKTELEALKTEKMDAEWAEVKKDIQQFAPGALVGEGKEQELRNAFESDAKKFNKLILAVKTKVPNTNDDGDVHNHAEDEDAEALEAATELKKATGRL